MIAYYPYPPTVRRKVALRTVLLPVLLVFAHSIIQGVVTVAYIFIRHFISLFSGAAATFSAFDLENMVAPLGLSALVQILIYSLVLWFLTRREPFYVTLLPRLGRQVPLAFATSLGALALAQVIVTGTAALSERFDFLGDMLSDYTYHSEATVSQNIFLDCIVVAVLVPIAEELLFRGIVVGELRRVLGEGLSIFLGGLIFALAHLNLLQMIYVLPAGLLFTAVYIYTDSLALVMLMHMSYNFFGSILPSLIGMNELVEDQVTGPQLAYLVASLAFLVLGLGAFVWLKLSHKKNRRRAFSELGRTLSSETVIKVES